MGNKVLAILLNWNGKEDTLACLRSLAMQEGVSFDSIVVDNGSTDGSVAHIRQNFSTATILENGANLGYAAGNNIGLRYGLAQDADYLLVLNNDTILAFNCMLHLIRNLEQYPLAAAAAPKSYYHSDPKVIYFGGGRIGRNGDLVHIDVGRLDDSQSNTASESDWLTGCAILFRAEALRAIGLFDPRYFLLYEDVDWSLRARRLGYKLRYAPEAHLWHKVSASFGKVWSSMYLYYYTRNALLYIESNHPFRKRPYLYYHALKRSWNIVKRDSCENIGLSKSVQRGIADYLLRRFGKRDYV